MELQIRIISITRFLRMTMDFCGSKGAETTAGLEGTRWPQALHPQSNIMLWRALRDTSKTWGTQWGCHSGGEKGIDIHFLLWWVIFPLPCRTLRFAYFLVHDSTPRALSLWEKVAWLCSGSKEETCLWFLSCLAQITEEINIRQKLWSQE